MEEFPSIDLAEIEEGEDGKDLYPFQLDAIQQISDKLKELKDNHNILFQLPTGGGKTVIFSEIARRYIKATEKKVLILTHRIELCKQTSNMLSDFGVHNKVIDSKVKTLPDQSEYTCFVAMVETLNNRLQDEKINIDNIGLVIVDEAHYNSFRKLFKYFEDVNILGVTATPLSSSIKLPMNENYEELVVGESISSLIKKGFLSKAITYSYNVRLDSLKIGINGDYTVKSSEQLYGNHMMQEKLLRAYEEKSVGKKTLIFNNGISTSFGVYDTFRAAGYEIQHLDHNTGEQERRDILKWFKDTPDAVITSVGILTTGFDEPTVETIILNRATRSLSLYHQMIGRGSRVLPNKKEFTVIDLGNNLHRFGLWDSPVDWYHIFQSPHQYYDDLKSDDVIERQFIYTMPDDIRAMFSKSEHVSFNIKEEYEKSMSINEHSKYVIQRSIDQHVKICIENAKDVFDAIDLAKILQADIQDRIRHYSYCTIKTTKNYLVWLEEDYTRRLHSQIRKAFTDRD
ncbi:MAG: DEAD/DEAH box helicase [Bacteroidetes bacterium]|nr:MAG: DEAD/DEAH box helicase [Bacteroidota bacterium]MBL1145381.1 DEAD/DEAH box helicase [Bacteroidota bacterium]NOG58179.1 DEAD/DEAH box helicase family protein [Bacteroidota bacterium]